MSDSILKSLRYLDELRLDPETDITRYDGSNVELLSTPGGYEYTLCHLSALLPFTFSDTGPYRPVFEDVASIALAAHHLNTGNGYIVPQLEGLHEKCNVRFTVEFADTQLDKSIAMRQLKEQLSRDGGERSACAFLGEYSSSVSIPTSLVTGTLGYPQISGASTSAELDNKALHPLFARTIPSDYGITIPVLQYMRDVLKISQLAIIHTNTAYPLSFVEGLRRAAAEYAPDMIFHQVPVENLQPSIESAVTNVKTTGVRFIFALVDSQELYDAVMVEAYQRGIAGTGVHNWLFADGFDSTVDGRSFEKGSPLHLGYRGAGQFAVSGGIAGIPSYDKYVESLSELANAEDLEYIGSLFPKQEDSARGDIPLFIDDPTFLKSTPSAFGSFMYEATIALGLSACSASNETSFFSGEEHFDHLRGTTFDSLSGNVYFDPTTGTRDPNSAFYKILNAVEEEYVDTDGRTLVKFNRPPTDIFLGGVWESREKYVFNDGTTNLPVDWAPLSQENSRLEPPAAIGIAAAGAVLVGLILFLFYEHKRKESDGIWKVKNEELKYSDPLEVIGRGTFGLVVLAEYRGTKVAVKRVIPPRALKRGGKKDSLESASSHHNNPQAGGSPPNSGSYDGSDNTANTESKSSVGISSGQYFSSNRNTPVLKSNGRNSVGVSSIRFGGGRSSMGEMATWKQLKQDFIMEMRHLSMLRHPCVTTVMGAVLEKGAEPMLVMEFMEHGSLYDLLHNETMVIEGELLLPILRDISQGVRFLHSATPQVIHGDLKAANILVDGKFRAKVADFGLSQKKALGGTGTPFWMAPELLRYESSNTSATDVYSFGVILYEVYSRQDPYEGEDADSVLRAVADRTIKKRPPIPESMPLKVRSLMADCLDDEAQKRPTFEELDIRLNRVDTENVNPHSFLKGGKKDQPNHNTISLFDIFPRHVAEALRDGRAVEPEHRECVTIFFCDIVGFTTISSELPPGKVAELLDRLYSKFDLLSQKHDVFKVETIGDSYMAVTNLIKDQQDDHAKRIAMFAIDSIKAANGTYIDIDDRSKGFVNIRVGFHSGSVVADVVGKKNPRYCLFGDTVNTASRMESNSKSNRIQCSEATAKLLKQQWASLSLQSRGPIPIKGKGEMVCYWVNESTDMRQNLNSPKHGMDFSSSSGTLDVLLEERSGYLSDLASDFCDQNEEPVDLESGMERAPDIHVSK